MTDSHVKSIVKSLSWRALATLTTVFLVFCFTGSFSLAASVGLIEVVAKLVLYYLHERVWLWNKNDG